MSWIVLTPEEWVRRHVVEFLKSRYGFSNTQIILEYPVNVNSQPQRADIVALGGESVPLILVECKAADITINGQTMEQAFRYNAQVRARYVMLTNGKCHYLYESTDSGIRALDSFDEIAVGV